MAVSLTCREWYLQENKPDREAERELYLIFREKSPPEAVFARRVKGESFPRERATVLSSVCKVGRTRNMTGSVPHTY
jgi:hypothetical protein